MLVPGADDLRAERYAVLETLESLDDETFSSGRTLCSEWSPRDILAHLMGTDTGWGEYVKARGSATRGNAAVVAKARSLPRDELMARGRTWAAHPSPVILGLGWFFLGDTTVHHQDILRGLGRSREVPEAGRDAILREGSMLGVKKLLSHRVVPTDGGRPRGRGAVVRGTREALGMWLAGREGIDGELEFG